MPYRNGLMKGAHPGTQKSRGNPKSKQGNEGLEVKLVGQRLKMDTACSTEKLRTPGLH